MALSDHSRWVRAGLPLAFGRPRVGLTADELGGAQCQEQLGNPGRRLRVTPRELLHASEPVGDGVGMQVQALRYGGQRWAMSHVRHERREQVGVLVERLEDRSREAPGDGALTKDQLL